MSKYKNKDGISLNYGGGDSHQVLIREVIKEAINILNTYQMGSPQSMAWAIQNGIDFLETNFYLKENRDDKWRINQYNRNRNIEDQISTIEELEERINEISNS